MEYSLLVVIFIWEQFMKVNLLQIPSHFPICSAPQTFKPFNIYWNVMTQNCKAKFGVDVNVKKYGIKENPSDGWKGEKITIFSSEQLGTYPRVVSNGTVLFGGIPQLVNMTEHLRKTTEDITYYMPDTNFSGLAVLDWEAWRPNWQRNFDSLEIYKNLSINLVKERHPEWTTKKIQYVAKQQFEDAARKMMVSTVKHAEQLRPLGQWGFYHYSNCYRSTKGTTENLPVCDKENEKTNDRILWLYSVLTGTYPSCYLYISHNTTYNYEYIYRQLQEQIRLANKAKRTTKLPIYPYGRFRYGKSGKIFEDSFYAKEDLVSTMTLPVMLGTDALVLWDDNQLQESKENCQTVKNFVDNLLGPIAKAIINATTHRKWNSFCSEGKCDHSENCIQTSFHTFLATMSKLIF